MSNRACEARKAAVTAAYGLLTAIYERDKREAAEQFVDAIIAAVGAMEEDSGSLSGDRTP